MSSYKSLVVEGTWLGYRSSQDRIVYRELISDRKLIEWLESTYSIVFSDGTSLRLNVRLRKPRERIERLSGYSELVQDCFYYNVSSVDALVAAQKESHGNPNNQ